MTGRSPIGPKVDHHHAVGGDHQPWRAQEIGGRGGDALRAVKLRLVPTGLMNPGQLRG